jgi:hypothetical protein
VAGPAGRDEVDGGVFAGLLTASTGDPMPGDDKRAVLLVTTTFAAMASSPQR